ncbi:hypothetical protein COMNV_00736 [Commensalibacter sp. Nvir]|uniref:helix-turn-helix domain-containing protein n=1 Tax=Commensalibacter sp. Nvir TaxID=3069817 RepID=UPI002D5C69D1|nr:hypothetical protein COMNV_00736 [Commensalibacter sp. Nvir]
MKSHYKIIMETLGDKIRKIRYKSGLKQIEFVTELGIDRSYLSKIESNKIKPGRELLIKMSKEFNVSLDWLTSDQYSQNPASAQNNDEAILLYAFRNLPDDEAKALLEFVSLRSKKLNKKK